jgi:hypothetical protein
MAESQSHGFEIEKDIVEHKIPLIYQMVKDNFIYNSKWDFPPLSIKTFKFSGRTLEFGSIERIFRSTDDFVLVACGHEQNGNFKEIVFSDAIYISNKIFRELKGDLTLEDINYLNQTLNTFGIGKHEEARKWAKEAKEKYNCKTSFDIRFKIDSKKQRRIQCALKLEDLYEILKRKVDVSNKLSVNNIKSNRRS